eukprot:NODE_625_length_5289_cov_0.416956.p2 type:complete len:320 gc:universal NODE_625_length_5289_cov_0.416956:2792-3751(+)
MNFSITSCLNVTFCRDLQPVFQKVATIFNENIDITLNVNFSFFEFETNEANLYGISKPSKMYTSTDGMSLAGFDYPQGLARNLNRYSNNSIWNLSETDFNIYDVELALNSKYQSQFILNDTDLRSESIDTVYLISRLLLRGAGIYSAYTSNDSMLTTEPLKVISVFDQGMWQNVVETYQNPTIYDRHLYISIERSYIWQYQQQLSNMKGVFVQSSFIRRVLNLDPIPIQYLKNAFKYLTKSKNVRFMFETTSSDGLLINDRTIHGKLVLDLLNEQECTTSEFLLCVNLITGRKFSDMYEGITLGPKILHILRSLGYRTK